MDVLENENDKTEIIKDDESKVSVILLDDTPTHTPDISAVVGMLERVLDSITALRLDLIANNQDSFNGVVLALDGLTNKVEELTKIERAEVTITSEQPIESDGKTLSDVVDEVQEIADKPIKPRSNWI